jgi:hypothetical protein
MIPAFLISAPATVVAQDLQSKYVGQTGCGPDFQRGPGTYGIRLDRSQRAYLMAHRIKGRNVLTIIQYENDSDKCGIVRDVVQSSKPSDAFEFNCVDRRNLSAVVIGTRPEKAGSVTGAAVEAWRIDLEKLKFVADHNRVKCVRKDY